MAANPPESLPGAAGVPRSWERRYRGWARQAVQSRSTGSPFPPDRATGDGLHRASLLAVLIAALSGVIGLAGALLFNLGLGAGLAGLAASSAVCWWWLVRLMAFIEGH